MAWTDRKYDTECFSGEGWLCEFGLNSQPELPEASKNNAVINLIFSHGQIGARLNFVIVSEGNSMMDRHFTRRVCVE